MNHFLQKGMISLFILFFSCSSLLLAQNESEESDSSATVEEMPRFPGCEEIEGDAQEKKSCADLKLLKFVYNNIKYPTKALLRNKDGMAVVSFVVTTEGKIEDVKILRNPGAGMGEEAARVVRLMNKLEERWTPGKKDGEPVNVQYNLPIRFKLDDSDSPKKKKPRRKEKPFRS